MMVSPEGRDTIERHTGSHLFRYLKYPRGLRFGIAQSAEGATQPSPDREVGESKSMMVSPGGRDTIERKG
jgi:hypothetical protein